MVFFSEDKPRTCCCGCTMTMGVIFFTILSALQGVQLMNQGLMDQSVPSFIFAGTGIAALMSDSYAVRQLNNCVWSLFAGVTVFVMLFIILVMAKAFSENGVLLHIVAIYLLVIVPWCYLIARTAREFAEELKDREDEA